MVLRGFLFSDKDHDRFNNRQSGHGHSHKSLSNYSFSIFLLTNSLKSLPFNKFFESKARS
jgi:hypothetical protein